MSEALPDEYNKKCVFIGNKYFFYSGKFSINRRPYCFILTLIFLLYNYSHSFYYIIKFLNGYITIPIIFTILFTFQIIQTLLTALIDPGSFLPNKSEDASKSSETTLMFASILDLNFSLKFCYTCKIARDLRVYHCPDCNLCILRHDHHCSWLSTCVGLNNHKHFIILIIINAIFFCFNSCVLIYLASKIHDLGFEVVDIVFIVFIIIANLCFFLFHLVLIYNHIHYICTGQTTREKIKRKEKGGENPFELPSGLANAKEFCFSPMKYKERINYNAYAAKYLDSNILINDYLSGKYKIAKDKTIISQTLIDNGYNYPKDVIEMPNKTYESDEEETSRTIKINDEISENKKEIFTNN